jgi:UDP-hydrolysing UDP-N-acetyl-D-glucosamine 2-epimerase
VQGGEVTGSIDEKVRHAVTKLSNVHFVSTEQAAVRVKKMGEVPETVYVTGCPSVDIAAQVVNGDSRDFDPFEKYGGVGALFDYSKGYLVVMQHPVTTEYDSALDQIRETLDAVRLLELPTFWFWPNVDAGSDAISKGIRQFRENNRVPFIHFFKNMTPDDFLRLLLRARCLVGNSSVGIRESAYLGLPVVNIGNRQRGRERAANVVDVGYDSAAIGEAIKTQLDRGWFERSYLYGDGQAGIRISALLARIDLPIEKRLAY